MLKSERLFCGVNICLGLSSLWPRMCAWAQSHTGKVNFAGTGDHVVWYYHRARLTPKGARILKLEGSGPSCNFLAISSEGGHVHKLRCRSLGGGVAFCSSCRKHGPTSRMMHEFDWMSIRMADQCGAISRVCQRCSVFRSCVVRLLLIFLHVRCKCNMSHALHIYIRYFSFFFDAILKHPIKVRHLFLFRG